MMNAEEKSNICDRLSCFNAPHSTPASSIRFQEVIETPNCNEAALPTATRTRNSSRCEGEVGGRERPNEDETGVTSRGREGKSGGREGLTAPKRVRGAPKTQWEGECFFFAAGMKRKEFARKNLQTPQQVERSWSQL
ncbi:hypothetical protein TNCV_536401 [Trichonephila clavipes]|nr:hypothetical protein TNCV_536401 [Trichonephila clavipes]